jgi:tetratricopeptide (TPR) repeat protein
VKTRHPVLIVAGLFTIAFAALPALVGAQCENRKDVPKAPDKVPAKVMVPTFHGDGKLAVEFSKDLRVRIEKLEDSRRLFVIPCETLNAYLTTSGYKADSALAINDLGALGKQVNASESLDGNVSRTPDGQVTADARMYFNNSTAASEPLASVTGKDVEEAARKIGDEYVAARVELDGYRKCSNGITDQKYDAAAAGAKEGITAYPTALLSRTCLLTAYSNIPATSLDTMIVGSRYILLRDTANTLAMAYLGDAYAKRAENETAEAAKQSDKDSAVVVYLKLYDADQSQTAVAQAVVAILAESGSPEKALAIVDTLALTNPDDPQILDTRFLLLLKAKQYRRVYKAFDVLIKADSTKETVDYYQRVIGAAQADTAKADSSSVRILKYASQGSEKFPKEASFWILVSDAQNDKGQYQLALAAAKKALQIDPKKTSLVPYIMQLYGKLNAPDSAIAFARVQIAAGANKDSIGSALVSILNVAIRKPQAEGGGTKENWQAMLDLAQQVDSVAPTAGSKFYIGFAAISVGQRVLFELDTAMQTPTFDKTNACATVAKGSDLVQLAYDSMTSGGGAKFNQESAASVLTNYPTLVGSIGDLKKAIPNCK